MLTPLNLITSGKRECIEWTSRIVLTILVLSSHLRTDDMALVVDAVFLFIYLLVSLTQYSWVVCVTWRLHESGRLDGGEGAFINDRLRRCSIFEEDGRRGFNILIL